jgi:hypothetical protein
MVLNSFVSPSRVSASVDTQPFKLRKLLNFQEHLGHMNLGLRVVHLVVLRTVLWYMYYKADILAIAS